MIYLMLILLGLCLGSFVNALVWRLYKQQELIDQKPTGLGKKLRDLSIVRGRSMCLHCGHELAPLDLVPVFSWVFLRGRCRYCKAKIDDTPFTELALPVLFALSFWAWPYAQQGWNAGEIIVFGLWLGVLTGFLALVVYDIKWFILPDKIIIPITFMVVGMVLVLSTIYNDALILYSAVAGAVIISGIFWLMAHFSDGKWIGGGDVKLGVSLGLLAGSSINALMLIFLASLLGTIIALPKLLSRSYNLKSLLPFGPFLIIAGVVMFLWGPTLYEWYFGVLV